MITTRQFLLKYQHEPWVRGKHDCILFIHKFLTEVHGSSCADPEGFKYDDYKGAKRQLVKLLKESGVRSFESFLDKHYFRMAIPVEGGLIAKEDTEGLTGYSYGVVYEGFSYFVGESGLKPLEINPTFDLFWSVD